MVSVVGCLPCRPSVGPACRSGLLLGDRLCAGAPGAAVACHVLLCDRKIHMQQPDERQHRGHSQRLAVVERKDLTIPSSESRVLLLRLPQMPCRIVHRHGAALNAIHVIVYPLHLPISPATISELQHALKT